MMSMEAKLTPGRQAIYDEAERLGYSERQLVALEAFLEHGLTFDQFRVCEHIRRFGITTPATLRRATFRDPERSEAAVKLFLGRLRRCTEHRAAVIDSAALTSRHRYYFLTRAGHRLFGQPRKQGRALGVVPLATLYGTLLFCTKNPDREKLTAEEFAEDYPMLVGKHFEPNRYYRNHAVDPPRLGFVFVNTGASTAEEMKKFRTRIIGERRRNAAWSYGVLDDPDAFEIGVVASHPAKCRELGQALASTWPELTFVPEAHQELAPVVDRGGTRHE